MLIDDFTGEGGMSNLGMWWEGVTDRTVGGKSDERGTFENLEGKPCLRMQGTVRAFPNDAQQGGENPRERVLPERESFISMVLSLAHSASVPFDASRFQGIRFFTRGNECRYFFTLSIASGREEFKAGFHSGLQWSRVEIPFSEFKATGQRAQIILEVSRLNRISLLALGSELRDEQADVAIADLEFI